MNNPCDGCEVIDFCDSNEKCTDRLAYEKEIKTMEKKNYVWDNKAFSLAGTEVEITAVYKTKAKNGNEYFQFYIKGDNANIYCTKWKKFFYVNKGDRFNVKLETYNNQPTVKWEEVK